MRLNDVVTDAVSKYNPVIGHIIKTLDGDLSRITQSEVMAKFAIAEGKEVLVNARMSDFLDVMEPCELRSVMDPDVWENMAPKLAILANHVSENMESVDDQNRPAVTKICTPPDWPIELVRQRFETLQKVFDPRFDLGALVELNELAFADRLRNDPRTDLFSEGSLSTSWKNMTASSDEDLLTELQMIDERESEKASEKAAFGDGPVGSARESQVDRMVEHEIEYLLDQRHPKQNTSLTEEDVEYGPCMADPNCPF